MDIKSFGALPKGPALDEERAKAAEKLRSQTAFVRATPPQATPDANQEEIRQGLVRMADYLLKFKGKNSKSKKKKQKGHKSKVQKALTSYSRVAQGEIPDNYKGIQFSKSV